MAILVVCSAMRVIKTIKDFSFQCKYDFFECFQLTQVQHHKERQQLVNW